MSHTRSDKDVGQKFVVFNADDFGYSDGVNRAIFRAHTEGVLTSTSLMVAEPGFAQAVEGARELPALGVGLHLVVTNDRAALPREKISALVNPDGRFGADPFRTGLKYAFSKTAQTQLRIEIEAQFARFAETGLAWSHVDGHQHFHLPPVVWDCVLENCVRYGVFRLRVPREEIRAHLRDEFTAAKPDLNTVASIIFRALTKRNLKQLHNVELKTGKRFFRCDRVYGHLQTGNMTTEYTLGLLNRLGGLTNEIYFHPGAPHARALSSAQQRDPQNSGISDVELAALLNPEVKQAMQKRGFFTGTFAQAEDWRNLMMVR